MFVDFNKIFDNKKQTKTKLSPVLIQHISQSLPTGLKYKEIEDGMCIIEPEKDNDISIKGLQITPTKEQLEIIGNPLTIQKIFDYAYNSQESIPLKLVNDKIIVNDKEIDSNKFIWTPDNSVDIASNNGKWFAIPPKMNQEFSLSIGGNNESINLKIRRIPNKSIDVYEFESMCDNVLELKYKVNNTLNQLILTMNIHLNKSKCLKDSLTAIKIYNAFIKGEGNISGEKIFTKLNSNTDGFGEEFLNLIDKMIKIEEILGFQFNPNFSNVDMETHYIVEKLYQNIVKNNPIRDNSKLNSIAGEWKFDKEEKEIKESIGKPMFFKFEGTEKFNLMNNNFELPCMVCVFNSRLDDIVEKGKSYNIKLVDEEKYKPMYMSILIFKSVEELNKYDIMKNISIFKDSKTIADYINAN